MSNKINWVRQENMTGCFVACMAMLLRKSYWDALKLIHPNQFKQAKFNYYYPISMTVDESIDRLCKLGLTPRESRLRKLSNLNRTSLLVIQWKDAPTLSHGVVYDARSKNFLDPDTQYGLPIHKYESQLHKVFYFDNLKVR